MHDYFTVILKYNIQEYIPTRNLQNLVMCLYLEELHVTLTAGVLNVLVNIFRKGKFSYYIVYFQVMNNLFELSITWNVYFRV